MILQEQRTLDQVMLSSIKTFYNGCNFTLKFKDDNIFLSIGCYGIHPNLISGDEKLLFDFFVDKNDKGEDKDITKICSPNTIGELKKRNPCERCGGFIFYEKT